MVRRPRTKQRSPRCTAKLRLEFLEDRLTPATVAPADTLALPAVSGELDISVQATSVVISQPGGSPLQSINRPTGAALQLVGADGGDTFAVSFVPPRGLVRTLPPVVLAGGNGANSVVVNGAPGSNQVSLQDDGGSYHAGIFTLQLQNLQNIQLVAQGSQSNVSITDAQGGASIAVTQTTAQMTYADGDSISATGFATVQAIAPKGAGDSATVTANAIQDQTTFSPVQSVLHVVQPAPMNAVPQHPTYTLKGFANVQATADPSTGEHFLTASGSSANDSLTLQDDQGQLRSGAAALTFTGYQTMAFSSVLGHSQATITADTTGNDTLIAGGYGAYFLQGTNNYSVHLGYFSQVQINDTSGGTNLLTQAVTYFRLSTTGFIPSYAYHPLVGMQVNGAFGAIRAITLQLDPGLAQITDPLQLSIALRDFVNQRFNLGWIATNWLYLDPYTRFLTALVYRTQPLLCQGVQIVFGDVLAAFGIPSRYVGLFAGDGNTHATTEVLVGGHWAAMDALFDVSFVSASGNYLSYAQLAVGVPFTVQHDGTVSQPQLTFETWPEPFKLYLAAVTYPPSLG